MRQHRRRADPGSGRDLRRVGLPYRQHWTRAARPGASISFVTAAEATSGPRVVLQGLTAVEHGKVRVSATTSKLSCTGRNRILGGDGIASERVLELIKRVAP
jgi:hypothetical protein